MQLGGLQQKLSKQITLEDNKTVEAVMDCDCLPICTDLSYHSETSQTNWNWVQQNNALDSDTEKEDNETEQIQK